MTEKWFEVMFACEIAQFRNHFLSYSTYLGNGAAVCQDIAVDAQGNAYITGVNSADFAATPGALHAPGGNGSVFVMKLNAAGNAVLYASTFGGDFGSGGTGIAVDAAGNAVVAGITFASDFPTTPGALQTAIHNHNRKAFVAKLNPTGSALIYSTYLAGTSMMLGEQASDVAVDSAGNAYVVGISDSSDFPTTPGAFQTSKPHTTPKIPPPFSGIPAIYNEPNTFVAKLNPAGTALLYSTYLGGDSSDLAAGIAIDNAGNACVVGYTMSNNFLTTADAVSAQLGGVRDGFVAKIGAAGDLLMYSTYLGGSGQEFVSSVNESGGGIAVDSAGSIYVAGITTSKDFPTLNPIQGSFAESDQDYNTFVTKISGNDIHGLNTPSITGVSINGKKLIVTGQSFVNGASMIVNGVSQATVNDSQNPNSTLISKKGGKKIKPGDSVMIQVQNPNGSLSNEYRFTRSAN